MIFFWIIALDVRFSQQTLLGKDSLVGVKIAPLNRLVAQSSER
jgi:hypothetical protein